jgi:hypothetical protein
MQTLKKLFFKIFSRDVLPYREFPARCNAAGSSLFLRISLLEK